MRIGLGLGMVWAFAWQVGVAALRYGTQVAFARYSVPVSYGEYAYAFSWLQLLIVPCSLGFTLSVLRFLPRYIGSGDWGAARGLLSRAVDIAIAASMVVGALGVVGAENLARSDYRTPLALMFCGLPFFVVANVQKECYRAAGRVGLSFGLGEALPLVLTAVAAATLVVRENTLTSREMIAASILGMAGTAGVQRFAIRRVFGQAYHQTLIPEFRTGEWVRATAPLFGVTLFIIVLNHIDVLLVGMVAGPKQAGIYSACAKTAYLGAFALAAVNARSAPMIARAHARGDEAGMVQVVRRATVIAAVGSICIVAPMVLASGALLGVFGAEYAVGSRALQILAVGQLINSFTGPVGYVLIVLGRGRLLAVVYGIACLVECAALILLIGPLGLTGAALASTLAVGGANAALYVSVRRQLGIKPLYVI